MQYTVDIVSLLVLTCALAASVRITLHNSFDMPENRMLSVVTHSSWCLTLLLFMPWTVAGYAKGEISYLPWEAFSQYSGNGMLDATVFFLCVLVVDLWLFVATGQLLSKIFNESSVLSDSEKAADSRFYIIVNVLVGFLIIMEAHNLYYIFEHISAITTYFIVGITVLGLYFQFKFTPAIVAKAPAILTTCGILGTFIGVAIGLMDFNPNAIQQSVPALIDGIKTAFWASACGIFFALSIKLREVFFGARLHKAKSRATIDDLAALMASVEKALAGKEDSSLHRQMTLARHDNNERLEALTKVMENYVNQRQGASETRDAHPKLSLAAQN